MNNSFHRGRHLMMVWILLMPLARDTAYYSQAEATTLPLAITPWLWRMSLCWVLLKAMVPLTESRSTPDPAVQKIQSGVGGKMATASRLKNGWLKISELIQAKDHKNRAETVTELRHDAQFFLMHELSGQLLLVPLDLGSRP